jgi:hypothetical protein
MNEVNRALYLQNTEPKYAQDCIFKFLTTALCIARFDTIYLFRGDAISHPTLVVLLWVEKHTLLSCL